MGEEYTDCARSERNRFKYAPGAPVKRLVDLLFNYLEPRLSESKRQR